MNDDTLYSKFLCENRQYWKEIFDEELPNSSGHILVNGCSYSFGGNLKSLTVSTYLARELNLEPVFMIRGNHDQRTEVCESYYPGETVLVGGEMPSITLEDLSDIRLSAVRSLVGNFLSFRHSAFKYPSAVPDAVQLFVESLQEVDSIEDLVALRFNDIPIGHLVYNQAKRRTARGAFESFDTRLQAWLLVGCLLYEQWQRLFDEYDVKAITVGHFWYLWQGLLGRVALSNGADVYVVEGKGSVTKYRSMESTKIRTRNPSDKLFNHFKENDTKTALNTANEILERRLGFDPDSVEYGSSIRVPATDGTLLDDLHMDADKPTLLLMQQNFVENCSEEFVFLDHYRWFRDTVRYFRNTKDYNLLIKPHPNRDFYESQGQVSIPQALPDIRGRARNISIVPDDVDIASLINAVDAITTINGAPGMEYPSLGVPVIVGGRNRYTGFGFTHEPATRDEYFTLIDSISEFGPLVESQRTNAKILLYLQARLLVDNLPVLEDDESEWRGARRIVREYEESGLGEDIEYFVQNDYDCLFPHDEIDH